MAHWRACTPCIYVGYHSRFHWSADEGHLAIADEEERHEKGDADGGVHLARPVVHVPRYARACSASTPAGRAQWRRALSLGEREKACTSVSPRTSLGVRPVLMSALAECQLPSRGCAGGRTAALRRALVDRRALVGCRIRPHSGSLVSVRA